jgi:hypothetical protein
VIDVSAIQYQQSGKGAPVLVEAVCLKRDFFACGFTGPIKFDSAPNRFRFTRTEFHPRGAAFGQTQFREK